MTVINAILFVVLGLSIGSFLNVVIFRVPNSQSIVTPGSHCPECGHYLRAWELIPVVSYLILRGKCGKCGNRISWRYPAIELLTAILFVLVFFFRPERTMLGIGLDLIFLALLIALTFIDIDTFRLPDILVLAVVLTGFINILLTKDPGIWQGLGGALAVGGVFALIAYFYSDGMGWGDVKFVAALGLYLGIPNIFIAVFIASLLGVIIGGLRIVLLKIDMKEPIPFGPFLAGGAIIMLLFGKHLADCLMTLS